MGRLSNDIGLVSTFWRHGGTPRAVLIACCTAVVSALLLVALTVCLWWVGGTDHEDLANVVADPGVRGGYVFALVLICLPPLALLRQVLRLGTADREQRLAGLRLAGASPSDVRRLGAIEVGLPAFTGGLLGLLVFLGLRAALGGPAPGSGAPAFDCVARELRLVPMSVIPSWWQVLLTALLVGLAGATAGASASRSLVVSPLGVSRRAPRSAPRPWGAVPLLLAVPVAMLSVRGSSSATGLAGGIACVTLVVVGVLGLTSWLACRTGRTVAGRATRPHVLVAARRLAADPRPAGRASAVIGAISLVAGFGGGLIADLPATSGGHGFSTVEPMYTVPVVLASIVLLVALVMVVLAMAVHGAESLMDRKRAVASLAALGTTHDEMVRVQRWEVGLVALPVTTLGLLLGSAPTILALGWSGPYLWIPLLVDVTTLVAAWVAVRAATRLTRRWLVRAASPVHLRTT